MGRCWTVDAKDAPGHLASDTIDGGPISPIQGQLIVKNFSLSIRLDFMNRHLFLVLDALTLTYGCRPN